MQKWNPPVEMTTTAPTTPTPQGEKPAEQQHKDSCEQWRRSEPGWCTCGAVSTIGQGEKPAEARAMGPEQAAAFFRDSYCVTMSNATFCDLIRLFREQREAAIRTPAPKGGATDVDGVVVRLAEVSKRIAKMCSELRPPRMSIPVQQDDDDTFICQTAKEAVALIEALERQLADEERESEHYLRLAFVDAGANPPVTWKERAEQAEAQVADWRVKWSGADQEAKAAAVRNAELHDRLRQAEAQIEEWSNHVGHMEAQVAQMRVESEAWRECALYDATIEGPRFKGWDRSALDRCRRRFIEAAPPSPSAKGDDDS